MTRQEMASIIARALLAVNKRTKVVNPEPVLSKFKDRKEISGFANESIASLVNLGILQGANGNFYPKRKATRAEAAVAAYKIFEYINKTEN